MQFSVIILNYNVKHFTDACLQSVRKAVAGKDAEIIVADNHSTDSSQVYFKNQYPEVKFLWFDENLGFAKAYNRAVQQAKGRYILILNPDTLVSENILDEFLNFAEKHKDFGIIGGKMIDGTGHFLPESKRGVPTPIVAFSKLTKLHKILKFKPFDSYYAPELKEDDTGKVAVLTGALMFMSKELYEKAGGFDESYFMYGEDIDLSYSILQSGYQNYYLPAAKIIHFKGESAGKDDAYYHNFLNTTFQFYRKHFRSFPVTEFLMRQFFKLWLSLRLKKKHLLKPVVNYKVVYFLGRDKYYQELTKHFPELKFIHSIKEINTKPALLVFDTESLAFSEIIKIMEELKSSNVFFRFYFPHNKMLLGSDHKDALGEVNLIDNE